MRQTNGPLAVVSVAAHSSGVAQELRVLDLELCVYISMLLKFGAHGSSVLQVHSAASELPPEQCFMMLYVTAIRRRTDTLVLS